MNYAAIDPGVSGGMAFIKDNDFGFISFEESINFFRQCSLTLDLNFRVFIEKVHSSPIQGVKNSFSFGKNFGQYLGLLKTLGFRHGELPLCPGQYFPIKPQHWQLRLSTQWDILSEPPSYYSNKKYFKELASKYLLLSDCSIKATLKNADAFLMLKVIQLEHA